MKFAFALLPLLLFTGCSGTSGPSIELIDADQHVGKLKTEKTYRIRIRMRNKGTEPLLINDVETGCGCTKPIYPKSVAPGAKALIELEFTPDILWSGSRSEPVIIRTNDPVLPQVIAEVSCDLEPPILFDSPSPKVVKFVPGTPKTFVLRGVARDGSVAPVLEATTDDPRAKVKLESKGNASTISVTMGEKKVAGDIDARLKLKTNVTSAPWIEFRLRAEADGAPFVSPAMPLARELKASAGGTRISTLSLNGRGSSPHILSVESSDPAIELKIEKNPKATRAWVVVTYKGGWQPGKRTATVRIVTDHPVYPVIEAPVVANVVPG